jgi:hypothetical protein
MPIRLLGDAVLRGRAWEVADQPGWASTYPPVHRPRVAGGRAVTLDPELARASGARDDGPIDDLHAERPAPVRPYWIA